MMWWDSVGEWQECLERFPNGIKEVTKYIRKKGMIPGVWLELTVCFDKPVMARLFEIK